MYFDSMVIPRLIVDAKARQFPASELTLTLTVHAAPRRLKMGKSLGNVLEPADHKDYKGGEAHETRQKRAHAVDASHLRRWWHT